MRKSVIIVIALVTTIVVLLVWRPWTTERDNDGKIIVVATIPLLADLVKAVGADDVTVEPIVEGQTCSHHFEPGPNVMKMTATCDIFIKMGCRFDPWADRLITSAAEDALLVDASVGIIPQVDASVHDSAGENHHDEVNPHYWWNPDNVHQILKNITTALIRIRPERETYYRANCDQYAAELEQTVSELQAQVASLIDKRVVSYSAAFPYFFAYFGFENLATLEETCEQEVSPARLAEVARIVEENGVRVIVGDQSYARFAELLALETGASSVLLWPTTDRSGEYLPTLRDNIRRMVDALQ